MSADSRNVAVIGAGTMGNGIAHVFAQSGHQVSLVDVNAAALDRALATIDRNLDRLVAKERISAEDKAAALSRLKTSTEMHGAVAGADLVVEAATERLDLKLKIFEQMDASAPAGAILATNTSSISITRIAAATQRPDKVIGMHFMNPVPIMKLVEVIRGYNTSDATTAEVVPDLDQERVYHSDLKKLCTWYNALNSLSLLPFDENGAEVEASAADAEEDAPEAETVGGGEAEDESSAEE